MAHIFFDLDRTLWHHERNHAVFFAELHREMNWSDWGSAQTWAATYLAINDRLWDHIQLHNLGVDYVRARRFPLLFKEMGLPHLGTQAANLLGDVCEAKLKSRIPDLGEGYDGAAEALRTLRDRGHHVHIITNGVTEPQRRKVAALGLSDVFDVLMTSDGAKSYKPDSRIFYEALQAAGAEASESWMVGDSALRDVLGGQRVGMRTAWYRAADALPADAEAQADFEFGNWYAFVDLLEAAIQG